MIAASFALTGVIDAFDFSFNRQPLSTPISSTASPIARFSVLGLKQAR
jgi:hypothetical protein